MLAIIYSPIFPALLGALLGAVIGLVRGPDAIVALFVWLSCLVIAVLGGGLLAALATILPLALTFVLQQIVIFAVCVVILGWFASRSKG